MSVESSKHPLITLASASPRRGELLEQIHVSYEVLPVDIDESHLPGETAEQYVKRLAQEKAEAGYLLRPGRPALGADTIVVLDQQILGKPVDREMAIKMLGMLSARQHQVVTAVALCTGSSKQCAVNVSDVEFAQLNPQQIESYWQTGDPADKAGAYGIQGIAAQFIRHISGSYSSIMGLPLFETAELLRQAGIDTLSYNYSE